MWLSGALGHTEQGPLKQKELTEMTLHISLQAVKPGASNVKAEVAQSETYL